MYPGIQLFFLPGWECRLLCQSFHGLLVRPRRPSYRILLRRPMWRKGSPCHMHRLQLGCHKLLLEWKWNYSVFTRRLAEKLERDCRDGRVIWETKDDHLFPRRGITGEFTIMFLGFSNVVTSLRCLLFVFSFLPGLFVAFEENLHNNFQSF